MTTYSSDMPTPNTHNQFHIDDQMNAHDFSAVGISVPPNNDFRTQMDMTETPIFSEYFEWGLTNLLRQQPPFKDGY